MEAAHMFDGNPKVGARHWMLLNVFAVACHLNAMLAQFIYILIIPCVCVCVQEWELPWWQPINSALGDSVRRNSDSRAALVMQYGSTGIRELSYTLKVTLCVCVCVCAPTFVVCLFCYPVIPPSPMGAQHETASWLKDTVGSVERSLKSWVSNFQQSI